MSQAIRSFVVVRHVLGAAVLVVATAALLGAHGADPRHVKQLRETNRCRACDLQGADLSGLVLEQADLRNADLGGALMYKTRLRGANLTGANFSGADLSGADLRGARGANLAGATTNDQTRCVDGSAGPCQ